MHFAINSLIQRLDVINQLRVERTLSAADRPYQRVYNDLPLLFHYHHPAIPGYTEDEVPHGVCLYQPNAIQKQSFSRYSSRWGGKIKPVVHSQPAISAIYSMGSSSSIAQTCFSDLDIWICLQPRITASAISALQRKCQLISAWSSNQGITISFFIIDEQRFRHSENHNSANYDDCHATQDLLLLEEFYRTAVRLAGKRIMWYLVPVELELHYDKYVLLLHEHGALDKQEWFDLGGLKHLSVSGCLSAARQQMYSSRCATHKAVLKNLLLEIYTWEHPHSRLLAMDFKKRLQCGQVNAFELDPYCMMLERITNYLKVTHDTQRLERVRRCFYFKVCGSAANQTTRSGWRREILQQLIKQWDWDEKQTTKLDSRSSWHLKEAQEAYNELSNEILESYYNLQRFASSRPLGASTSLQEHGWLIGTLSESLERGLNISGFITPQIVTQPFSSGDPHCLYPATASQVSNVANLNDNPRRDCIYHH